MALSVGEVIRIPVAFKSGDPKYLVVVHLDTYAHCVVISSSIHPMFSGALRDQSIVDMLVSDHPFMHHDSKADCNEVKRLPLADVQMEINNNAGCRKGSITDELKHRIRVAIQASPFLSPAEKNTYIASLNGDES